MVSKFSSSRFQKVMKPSGNTDQPQHEILNNGLSLKTPLAGYFRTITVADYTKTKPG